MSSPASRSASDHVARQDVAVPAEPAQEILPRRAAEPAAVLAQIGRQPDLVVGRPRRQELAEAAMLFGDPLDEDCVLAHRHDLLAVAHDARVGSQLIPEIFRLKEQRLRLETKECLLESRPFCLDYAPNKACREDALGHCGQDAVVGDLGQRGVVGLWPKQLAPAPLRRPCAWPHARGSS